MAQGADDAGTGDPFRDVEAEQSQGGGHDARGAPLLEGQLGVRMQVPPQSNQGRQEVVDQVVLLQRHGRTVVGISDAG